MHSFLMNLAIYSLLPQSKYVHSFINTHALLLFDDGHLLHLGKPLSFWFKFIDSGIILLKEEGCLGTGSRILLCFGIGQTPRGSSNWRSGDLQARLMEDVAT